jgi:hypothetical protein
VKAKQEANINQAANAAHSNLFAGLLAGSLYISGRSCDRPTLGVPVFKRMLRRFSSSELLLRASHAAILNLIHKN